MNVLVDTSIWSLALRRQTKSKIETIVSDELKELVHEGRAKLIGSFRQELLSGISNQDHFFMLRNKLRSFPDLPVLTVDFERAAEFFNECRSHGIQGSHIDFLICAVSIRNKMSIFTRDKDFSCYAKILNITLHSPRKDGGK